MSNQLIELWGAGTTRTVRPIWTAEELGLAYRLHPIGPRTGETQTAEFTEMNRKQKIPYMKDGSLGLSESIAICRYLMNQYGEDSNLFLPATTISRAKEDEWISYIYGELDETGLYVIRRHGDLAKIYGEATAAVESCKRYVDKHLLVVEKHFDDRSYVMGDRFGLADIILISCLDWCDFYNIEVPNQLKTYHARVKQRPAYQKAYDVNYRR